MPAASFKECSGCRKAKSAVHFAKNLRDTTGLQPWCKSCHRRYNLSKPKVTIPTVQEKRCSTCKKLKSIHEFNKDVSKPTGLRSQCNVCRSDRRSSQRKKFKREAKRSKIEKSKPGKYGSLMSALLSVAEYELKLHF